MTVTPVQVTTRPYDWNGLPREPLLLCFMGVQESNGSYPAKAYDADGKPIDIQPVVLVNKQGVPLNLNAPGVYASQYNFSTDPLYDNGVPFRAAYLYARSQNVPLYIDLFGTYYFSTHDVTSPNYFLSDTTTLPVPIIGPGEQYLTFKVADGADIGCLNFANTVRGWVEGITLDGNWRNQPLTDGKPRGLHTLRISATHFTDACTGFTIRHVRCLNACSDGLGFEGNGYYKDITVEYYSSDGCFHDSIDMKNRDSRNYNVKFRGISSNNFDYELNANTGFDARGVTEVDGFNATLDPTTRAVGIRTRYANDAVGSISGGALNVLNVSTPSDVANIGWTVGIFITGPNIPDNTTITNIVGNTVTLSANATGAVTNGTFVAGNGPGGRRSVFSNVQVDVGAGLGVVGVWWSRIGVSLEDQDSNLSNCAVFNGYYDGAGNGTTGIVVGTTATRSHIVNASVQDQGTCFDIRGKEVVLTGAAARKSVNALFTPQYGFLLNYGVGDVRPQLNFNCTGTRLLAPTADGCDIGYRVISPGVEVLDFDALNCRVGISIGTLAVGCRFRPRNLSGNTTDWDVNAPVYIEWGEAPPIISASSDKTLTHVDVGKTIQINVGAADKTVTMPATGLKRRKFGPITKSAGTANLVIKDAGGTTIYTVTTAGHSATIRENETANGWLVENAS